MATSAPPDIVRSAYAELIVTDLGASKHFWVDRLGFVISFEDDDAVYLRGHEEFVHHSLILREGAEPASMSQPQFARTIAREIEGWKKVAKQANIKPE